MNFKFQQEAGVWTISALTGPLAGRIVGTTENAALAVVRFHRDGTMSARYLNAVYGAQFEEEVFEHPFMFKTLGINKSFEAVEKPLTYDPKRAKWVNKDDETMFFAHRVNLLHSNAFFRLNSVVETQACEDQQALQSRLETSPVIGKQRKAASFISKLKSLVS